MKIVAALFAAALFLSGCSTSQDRSAKSSPIVGAWRSRVQFLGGPIAEVTDLEFLYCFNQGGTMTESSNYDGAPPVPPAYGVWREIAPNRFEAKYLYYNSKPPSTFQELTDRGGWIPNGYGELTETIVLTDNGRSFESDIELQMYDGSGKAVEGGGKAKGKGERIQL
jgi:hypothetical protein